MSTHLTVQRPETSSHPKERKQHDMRRFTHTAGAVCLAAAGLGLALPGQALASALSNLQVHESDHDHAGGYGHPGPRHHPDQPHRPGHLLLYRHLRQHHLHLPILHHPCHLTDPPHAALRCGGSCVQWPRVHRAGDQWNRDSGGHHPWFSHDGGYLTQRVVDQQQCQWESGNLHRQLLARRHSHRQRLLRGV